LLKTGKQGRQLPAAVSDTVERASGTVQSHAGSNKQSNHMVFVTRKHIWSDNKECEKFEWGSEHWLSMALHVGYVQKWKSFFWSFLLAKACGFWEKAFSKELFPVVGDAKVWIWDLFDKDFCENVTCWGCSTVL